MRSVLDPGGCAHSDEALADEQKHNRSITLLLCHNQLVAEAVVVRITR